MSTRRFVCAGQQHGSGTIRAHFPYPTTRSSNFKSLERDGFLENETGAHPN